MLVTAIPFSPVMADDAGTTEAVQPFAMLDGKALGDAIKLSENYAKYYMEFDHVSECWTFTSDSVTGNGDYDAISLTLNVPASAHFVKMGFLSDPVDTVKTDNLNVFFNNGEKEIRTWSWDLPCDSLDGFVFDVSKITGGEGGTASDVSFETETTHKITKMYIKPNKSGVTSGVTLKFKYIAFFNTAKEANAYVYAPPHDYTVTYYAADGTAEFAKAYYSNENSSLVHIKNVPQNSDETYQFYGWKDENGNEIRDGYKVESDLKLYPMYISPSDNDGIGAIYDVNNMNVGFTDNTHINKSIVKTAEDGTYFRFTPKQAYEINKSGDGEIKTYFYFDNAQKIKMRNYPIMVVEYRAKTVTNSLESNMSIVGSDSKSKTMWGGSNALDGTKSEWTKKIFDLNSSSTFFNGGNNGLNTYHAIKNEILKCGFPNCYIARLGGSQNCQVNADDYLEVRYIGFFSTEEAANNYTYSSSTNWYKVDFVSEDKTISSSVLKEGSDVTFPTTKPEKKGYSFIGWYDTVDGGTRVTKITNLSADTTLYARFVEPSVIYDQHALTAAAANGFTSFDKGTKDNTTMVSLSGKYANTFESTYDETKRILKFTEKSGYDSSQTQKVRFGNDDNINNNGIVFNVDVPGSAPYVKLGMTANADNYGDNILLRVSKDGTGYGPWWSWRVDFAAEGGVFNATTGYRDMNAGDSWEGKNISDGGKIIGVFARPFNNSAKTEQAEMNVRYIAFFETEEAAENYVYAASEEYTVTYLEENGKVLTTQYYSKITNTLTLTDMLPTAPSGQAFDHWCFKDGSAVPDNYAVIENVTLYPSFTAPGAVFDVGNMSDAYANYSSFIDIKKSFDKNEYIYYKAQAKNTSNLPTTGLDPYSKVHFKFNSADNKVSMTDYPIMAVCYRGDFYDGKGETNLTVDNKTLWEGSDVSCVSSADWNLKLFDKNNAKKFYSGGSDGINAISYPYKDDLSNWVPTQLMMRISSSQTKYTDDNYFDVLYIAFFETEEQAKSYTYAPTTEWNTVTVTYSTDEAGLVTISGGAKLSETTDDDAKTTTVTYIVRNGESVTFTATPGNDYNMDGWYNVTNGHNVLLGDGADTIDLKVTSDTELNVRFLGNAVEKLGRLVVNPDRGVDGNAIGTISVDGVESDSWIDTYVSKRNSTQLTASVKEAYRNDYAFAFWWRLSRETESFLGATADIDVYPLGNQVVYQPVFAKKDVTVKLYVDFANTVIGVIDAEVDEPDTVEPSVPKRAGYNVGKWVKDDMLSSNNVEVYKPSYTKIYENENLLTIVDSANNEIKLTEENGLVYNAQVNLTPGQNHRRWYIIIENNGTFDEDGKAVKAAFTLSHKDKYSYYHVLEGAVEIRDVCKPEGEGAEYANSNYVHTLQVQQRDDNRIHFVASLNVKSGYELVERGVLMTNDAALADSGSFMINTPGVIEGRINETEVTDIYLVAKSNVKAGDTWYGRAYMIVKDKDTDELETVYANEILSKTYTESSTTVTD